MNLDKPLDDIIKSKPKGRGGKAGGRPSNSRKVSGGAKAAAIGGKAANAAAVVAANRNKPLVIPGRAPGGNQGSKIIVSNLPLDVTEAQVKELFSTTIGPLRRLAMSYRANGTSTGQVTVEFQKFDDATRAYQQYNNRLIDGKKTLRVEVVVDPARAAMAQAPTAIPAAAAAGAVAGARAAAGRGGRGGRGAARGAGRGGRGAAATRQSRPQKSAADLDAEMEDYAANKADPAA
ncbi:hypothetical protein BCV69DRAFT_288534 [Microstroma glucosiphilum]|uniref:RRM domain-containing protein n=1 Tax=Pseudomicrostroma glucosiphilum TaxID=1684307 RepID=A0A316TY81_9BASI|nr:hypothetical protein BCV69DRAFT_288534 [Pseudomicrostroma glucosiphilum]PWN18256.1 hypothetical protein BCV69DRAFT_288534 [Pseudomicrostroma glucosiphilum]